MEFRGEIIFLGMPSDIYWEAGPYLKALYAAGILTVSFTPIPQSATLAEGAREIEEIITAATARASVVCVMSTRLAGWQEREELLRKLLYRISRKQLILQKSGGLLPTGTSHFTDLDDIPLFILPFSTTMLVMTPGTGATVYPFLSKIKKAISLNCCGRWIKMSGVSPTEVAEWMKKEVCYPSIRFKIVPKLASLDLLIASEKSHVLSDAMASIQKKFGQFCTSFDGEAIEEAVGAALLANNKSLAIAESCTGGEIAAKITRVPGASRYFVGGAVTYSNPSKEVMLSVPHRLIHEKGAVSSEVAARMANGIRKNAASDLGLAVTGIAGPTGGSREKPVGLVYIALASDKETTVTRHKFYGSRNEIREQAVQMGLETVLQYFEK